MEDILFIDKPEGISSFSVIRALRKRLKIKKMGHAGTLDPIASGLLIIGIGNGTKRLKDYFGLPKTYQMEVLLGKKTDTGDITGKITEEKKVTQVEEEDVRGLLKRMEGDIELPIPAYSAVKYRGVPFYKYARRRIKLEPRLRTTRIYYLRLLGIARGASGIILNIEMKCQKGTYARSVAEEIGNQLSMPSTIKGLRRLKVGEFDVSQAKRLDEINPG